MELGPDFVEALFVTNQSCIENSVVWHLNKELLSYGNLILEIEVPSPHIDALLAIFFGVSVLLGRGTFLFLFIEFMHEFSPGYSKDFLLDRLRMFLFFSLSLFILIEQQHSSDLRQLDVEMQVFKSLFIVILSCGLLITSSLLLTILLLAD